MSEKSTTISVRLPEGQKALLAAYSKQMNLTASEVIRQLVVIELRNATNGVSCLQRRGRIPIEERK